MLSICTWNSIYIFFNLLFLLAIVVTIFANLFNFSIHRKLLLWNVLTAFFLCRLEYSVKSFNNIDLKVFRLEFKIFAYYVSFLAAIVTDSFVFKIIISFVSFLQKWSYDFIISIFVDWIVCLICSTRRRVISTIALLH